MGTNGTAVEVINSGKALAHSAFDVPAVTTKVVALAVTIEEAKKEWEQYIKLCQAILEEQDYIYFVRYKKNDGYDAKPVGFRRKTDAEQFAKKLIAMRTECVEIGQSKKRSAWDKLAKFYNLSVPTGPNGNDPNIKVEVFGVGSWIVERRSGDGFTLVIYQHDDDLKIVKASATVFVMSPNGRTTVGEGVCAANERSRGADGFAHADHDIPSTAFTRALNRAISRCIGTGEVSADELESEEPAQPQGQKSETPVVPQAPEVEALPATAAAPTPERQSEAKPQQATLAAKQPGPTPQASPQAGDPGKTVSALSDGNLSAPAAPPAASAMTPEDIAKRLGGEIIERKSAEEVRKELAKRVNVLVKEILPKAGMKNIAAKVQTFIKLCADVPESASVKQVPTAKLLAVVDLMDAVVRKDGPGCLMKMIEEKTR